MRRVLVLRPEPGASDTLKRLGERGLDAIAVPLFELEPIAWTAPDPAEFEGLLLTSANAIRHGGTELERVRGLAVHAVGEATARAAREAGFEIATIGGDGVDRLLSALEPKLRLLHLRGEDSVATPRPRQSITPLTVYRAREVEAPDLSGAPGSVALTHSPRAGRRFAELVGDRSAIAVAAISPTAAESLGSGWQAVEVADQPSDAALLALAASLCNRSFPQ